MTALSLIAVNVLNMRAKINAVDRVSRNTEMAMNIITGNIQNAKSVNSAGASLSLEIYQGYNDPTVFSLSGLRATVIGSSAGFSAVPQPSHSLLPLVRLSLSMFVVCLFPSPWQKQALLFM